jgi:hypothetical protein
MKIQNQFFYIDQNNFKNPKILLMEVVLSAGTSVTKSEKIHYSSATYTAIPKTEKLTREEALNKAVEIVLQKKLHGARFRHHGSSKDVKIVNLNLVTGLRSDNLALIVGIAKPGTNVWILKS